MDVEWARLVVLVARREPRVTRSCRCNRSRRDRLSRRARLHCYRVAAGTSAARAPVERYLLFDEVRLLRSHGRRGLPACKVAIDFGPQPAGSAGGWKGFSLAPPAPAKTSTLVVSAAPPS